MSDYIASVKQIIYRAFVKYDRLQYLVYDTFSNSSLSNATELNIFIDLYSILKPIFSEHNRTMIEEYTELCSEIVNMCAHYRYFFYKLSVKTKFYLVWSCNTCDINRKFISDYNESFYNKSNIKIFNEFTNNNLDLLDILTPYLPEIYFIRSIKNYESSVIISTLIDTISGNIPNLIITQDIYPIQLTAFHKNTALLYPHKIKGSDESVMIPINEKDNFRNEFWKLLLISDESRTNTDILNTISPLNFPFLMSFIGMKRRGIKSLYTATQAAKTIYYINKGEDIKISIDQIKCDPELVTSLPISIIEARMNAFDVNYCKRYYKLDPEFLTLKFEDLIDNNAVNHINAKFFANNPIDVNKL